MGAAPPTARKPHGAETAQRRKTDVAAKPGPWCAASRGTGKPVVPERGNARRGACRTRLAGQMSEDTPRPPQETAREYASTGIAARECGVRTPWRVPGRPLELNTFTSRSRPQSRPRGAAEAATPQTDPRPRLELPMRAAGSGSPAAFTILVSAYRFGKNGVVDARIRPL